MTVAVTTYIDNSPNLITEFGWLFKSWVLSKSCLTSDLVAFYNPKIDLNLLPKHERVKYLPLKPLSEIDQTWNDYKFINSVYFLTVPEAAFLTNYDYVMRTDCDCFLTPNFPNLQPRLATFGIGLFALDPDVTIRLAQISKKWGIQPVFNSVGSTIMATGMLALHYSQIQLEYCKKLRAEEFLEGFGEWPHWYIGVLSMYAGQLAANAVFGTGLVLGGLDVQCMSRGNIGSTDYHIHAWHTLDHFSKFKWREGAYVGTDLNSLNQYCIADYCLIIAGEGSCK